MTEMEKKIPPKKTAPRKPAAKKPARDAYDAFLENAERAEQAAKQKRSAVEKKPVAKKPAQPRPKKSKGDLLMDWDALDKAAKPAAKPAAKKPAAKTPAAKKDAADKKSSAKTPAKPVAKKSAAKQEVKKPAAPRKKAPKKQAVMLVENGKKQDDYDVFLNEAERAAPKKNKRRKKTSARAAAAMLVLLLGIFGLCGLGGMQYVQYQKFLTMKAAVDRATFYDGITVEGVDVSGMTLEQALVHWETTIEPSHSQRKVTLNNGAEFTAAELGYASDYASILTSAWSAGRSGSLVERYQALNERKGQPVSYTVTRRAYDDNVVTQCAQAIAGQIDRPAEDSHIQSFDMKSYAFTFTDEVTGSQLDQAQLAQDIAGALDAGGGTVELVVRAIEPQVKKADIAKQYGMIASAITNASSSSSNRLSNIRQAMKIIHGTRLAPGETFSFNGVVGERTTDRGFKTATAYSSGKVIEDVGGGICQVSTTLFNAAVKADLEIVERHNHSLTVGYVDKGKDAAVNWDSQDLRFTNNTGDDVYICCYLTDDKRVRFGIFGKLLPNGESIKVEGVTTGEIEYETVMQPSMVLPSGATQIVQPGKVGYTAEAYKIRLDANGNQISRELLCKSKYRATDEIIEYGP